VDRLSELLGHHVQFAYTAWDRIVLMWYLDRLQRPENVSHFLPRGRRGTRGHARGAHESHASVPRLGPALRG